MAGIFFSTRLIPSPVLGNTPLVRVPLVPNAELDRIEAKKQRQKEIQGLIQERKRAAELEYLTGIERLVTEQTGQYLVAAWEWTTLPRDLASASVGEFARSRSLHPQVFVQWMDYIGLRAYRALASLSLHTNGIPGLDCWSQNTNSIPAIRLNRGTNSVVINEVSLPGLGLSLWGSKSNGVVVSWTSPLHGIIRLVGRIGNGRIQGGKNFEVALDLKTTGGRRQLALLPLAAGETVDLQSVSAIRSPNTFNVQKGDRIELLLAAHREVTPVALVDWTIEEVDGHRTWNLNRDLMAQPSWGNSTNEQGTIVLPSSPWMVAEAGDVRRPSLEPGVWEQPWVDYRSLLEAREYNPTTRASVEMAASHVEKALRVGLASMNSDSPNDLPGATSKRSMPSVKLSANDPRLKVSEEGRVIQLPNRARSTIRGATVAPSAIGPQRTNRSASGKSRPVLQFTGSELLEIQQSAPPEGSLFVVYQTASTNTSGQRILGWEDSDTGRHGIGLMPTPGGGLHAILRKDGTSGDIVASPKTNSPLELICLTWGPHGVALYRNMELAGKSSAIDGVSADPQIKALRIGGPGSGGASKFQGAIAEIRIFEQVLTDAERVGIEQELLNTWINPDVPELRQPNGQSFAFDELSSPVGPFWLKENDRESLLPSPISRQLQKLQEEATDLIQAIPTNLPQAVVVQEGGPKGTRHEGFKDAHVYLRGNPAKPGDVVPRGFPKILSGDKPPPITQGSGRRQLADWIASTNNPLTARVAVNRIWQHHFGQGLVRTSTNFGQRGERPTHPDLLDYLASYFIDSGWSMKALHRLILLSAVYQQGSNPTPESLAADPENRLLGHMNRTSLDAESLRDSLLATAGQLDMRMGGLGFLEMAEPRRSLYLMSVRTGVKSGFASIFDAPDSTAVVEKRSESTVAPQALFLLNDPFAIAQARAMARRAALESTSSDPERFIQSAYRIILGRLPDAEERIVARNVLSAQDPTDCQERLCQLLLCSNEFFYVD